MLGNNNNQPDFHSPVDPVDMLNISQNIDEFKSLDNDMKGYLDENQAKSYFESQCSSQKSCNSILSAAFDQTGQLSLEKFLVITHLLRLGIKEESTSNNDENKSLSRFSNLLRHCEESLKQVEKDRKNSSTMIQASKVDLSAAIVQLESCWKELLQSDTGVASNKHDNDTDNHEQFNPINDDEYGRLLDNKPEINNSSTPSYRDTAPSGTPNEVMPGSFNFDKKEEDNQNSNSDSNTASFDLPPVAPPRKPTMLSIDSDGKIISDSNYVDEKMNNIEAAITSDNAIDDKMNNIEAEITSDNVTDEKKNNIDEKEPNLTKSLSFASPTTEFVRSAKERSAPNNDIATVNVFDESLPSSPLRTNAINTLNSVESDSFSVGDDDIKREMEILKDEDEWTDIDERPSSIAKDIVIPSIPTTVVPSRAIEDPIVESNEDPSTITTSVPQHPMVQAERFTHPSFYSSNSYISIDDNKTNDVVSDVVSDEVSEVVSSSETPQISIEDVVPQLAVPVTKSPILTDEQLTSLTGMRKPEPTNNSLSSPEVEGNQDHNTVLTTNDDEIHNENNLSDSPNASPDRFEETPISVLPLLASPAVSNIPLNNNLNTQGVPSENTSICSDTPSGAIPPPPSFRSEVKKNITDNSSIGLVQNGNKSIESSTVKEPLHQPADVGSPKVTEILDSLDKKLDLIIEDDLNIINKELPSNEVNPLQDELLSTHDSLMDKNKRHSVISTESRFIELDDNISPMIKNNAQTVDKPSNEIDSYKDRELDTTNTKESAQIPGNGAVDLPPSPSSMSSEPPHSKKVSHLFTSFTDKSAAQAMNDTFELLATPSKTGKNERVLKVRKGFEGFLGLGIKCVHDD